MDAPLNAPPQGTYSTEAEKGNYRFALVALTSLFFMWGFITCLNDILIPHLRNVFSLSYTQAMLVQFCFFGAYFLASLPAGALVKRIGYRKGIVTGLVIAGIGCLLFLPAAAAQSYPFFLGALFILATGITVLQVSANPYVTLMGPVNTASARLNLTQAFNSLGTTIAPIFGALLILSATGSAVEGADISPAAGADTVTLPYLLLASTLMILALLFALMKLPDFHTTGSDTQQPATSYRAALNYRNLLLGTGAIFMYVGAEVSIGSLLVNFIGEANILALPEASAAHYVSFYWGGAMIGRFAGALLMRRIHPALLLAINASTAVALIIVAVTSSGALAMWSILLVGLCNSIMFPTIFSLALHRLGIHTSHGSGLLCLAIVGGAIVPLAQGIAADAFGVQQSLLMPIICYVYIAYFGFWCVKNLKY